MRTLKLSVLFLSAAIALDMSDEANAMDLGENKPFAQMEQTLKQEQQFEIARARYVVHPEDPARAREFCVKFTINARGDAYILMSNNMDDSKATMGIVYGKLVNAQTYNPRLSGALPNGVTDLSDLAAKIKRAALEQDGVMIHGQTIKRLKDGTEILAGTVTVLANLSNSSDPLVKDRVIVLETTANNVTRVTPVIAGNLQYRGPANRTVQNSKVLPARTP